MLWTRTNVAQRILEGELLIVYHGNLLRIPQKWLEAHPGGDLALLHFVGRDATDEIDAAHQPETLKLVLRYSVGQVEVGDEGWKPLMPPIARGWRRRNGEWHRDASEVDNTTTQVLLAENTQGNAGPTLASLEPPTPSLSLKKQNQLSQAYRRLHERVVAAGLYDTPYITGYGPEVARYLLLAFSAAYTYKHDWLNTSAVFLGLLWHQLVFAAHDLGHMGVTHNWTADRIIATAIADWIGGLSIGWWVQNHNVHHCMSIHVLYLLLC